MENTDTKLRTLTIEGSTPSVPLMPSFGTDTLGLTKQVALNSLSYSEFASLPFVTRTVTILGTDTPGTLIYAIIPNLNTFYDRNPEIENKWQWVRFQVKFTYEVTSHWQQRGSFGTFWSPYNAERSRYFYRWTNNQNRLKKYFWSPPDRRTFHQIGHTLEATASLPWISPAPAFKRCKLASDGTFPTLQSQTLGLMSLLVVTPLRSTANTTQTCQIRIWMQYTDVQVGGFIGVSRSTLALTRLNNESEDDPDD